MIGSFWRYLRSLTAKNLSYYKGASTGTGAEQTIAHGLGRVPDLVFAIGQAGNNGSGAAGTQTATILYGTHTATDLKVTVTSGSTYLIIAL